MKYIRSDSKIGGWPCHCGQVFRTRYELSIHRKTCEACLKNGKLQAVQERKNFECPFCNKKWETTKSGFSKHVKSCYENPNRVKGAVHSVSEKTKKKISETRKQKIASGEIKLARTLNHPSYPEQWLIDVLKNKFNMEDGKDYLRELNFHNYFLDFAWPERKLCIELDGRQHCEEDRKRRDQLKDGLLKDEGWLEVRVDWGWVRTHTKQFVKSLNDFFNKNTNKIAEINCEALSYVGHRNIRKKTQNKRVKKPKGIPKSYQIDSLGRVNFSILSNEEWERRKNTILNCGVDLTKFGWVGKVEKVTGLSKRVIEGTVKKCNIHCFQRKSNVNIK